MIEDLHTVSEGKFVNTHTKQVPTNLCALKLVKKWRITGLICDKKKQPKNNVLIEEKIYNTLAWSEISTSNCSDTWHKELEFL
jgi:hypothetical protein